MSKSLKKIVEESRDKNIPEVDMCDRGISNMLDIPGLCKDIKASLFQPAGILLKNKSIF